MVSLVLVPRAAGKNKLLFYKHGNLHTTWPCQVILNWMSLDDLCTTTCALLRCSLQATRTTHLKISYSHFKCTHTTVNEITIKNKINKQNAYTQLPCEKSSKKTKASTDGGRPSRPSVFGLPALTSYGISMKICNKLCDVSDCKPLTKNEHGFMGMLIQSRIYRTRIQQNAAGWNGVILDDCSESRYPEDDNKTIYLRNCHSPLQLA